MARVLTLLLLLLPFVVRAQDTSFPIFIGQSLSLTAPAVDAAGRSVIFGAGLTPDGHLQPTAELYVIMSDGTGLRRLTNFAPLSSSRKSVHEVALTPDGARAAFAVFDAGGTTGEEI